MDFLCFVLIGPWKILGPLRLVIYQTTQLGGGLNTKLERMPHVEIMHPLSDERQAEACPIFCIRWVWPDGFVRCNLVGLGFG